MEKDSLETLYQTIFENTGTGLLIVDEDTTVLKMNLECERIIGYPKNLLEGKMSWTEFVAKDHLEKMKQYHRMRRIDSKAAPATYESQLIDRQGNVKDVLLNVRMIPGTKKSAVSFLDITEFKLMEKKLKEQEEKYRRLVEDAQEGIWTIDEVAKTTYVNPKMAEILGYTVDEMQDRSLFSFTNEKNVETAKRLMERCRQGIKETHEFEFTKKNGTSVYVSLSTSPITDTKGNFIGAMALVTDITERKLMQKRIDIERRRLFSLLDELPAVIALFARDYSIRFSNRYFRERFGDVGGRFCYEILHNRKEPCDPCPSFRVFDTGKPETWESQRFDGRIYMTYDYPFRDIDGSALVLEVSYDITKRKQIEEALRESEERYRSLFEDSPISLWEEDYSEIKAFIDKLRDSGVSDFRGYFESHPEEVACCLDMIRVIDVNKATLELHRASSKDELRNNLKSVFRKETYAGFREELVAVAEGKTRFQMEIVTQTTTGNSVNADFRWHIAPGHEKTYSKILISIVDITKLKQMENKLRENTEHLEKIVEKRTAELLGSQRRLHLLTDALPALISYVDSDQRYRFNNRAYEEWFQHSRQEITGRRINEVLGETAYQTIQRYVAEALSGKKVTYESTVPYKDGGQRYIYATYVPDFDEEGKVKGFYALVNDITERKQMEQTLRKAERYAAIGEAAAMVGHDLRNPLQVIINRLYLAKKVTRSLSYPYSDVAAKLGLDELFKELEDQTIYMNKIVSDLQDYSKLLKPELVETSLRQLVDNTFSMMQVPKNIRISVEVFDFPRIMVDPELMKRVFSNIILNAIQAMPGGGQLTVKASEAEDVFFISFQDTGVGMQKENIDKIFSPLYTTKAMGAGLGLPVCKRLVEAHNGSIMVESQVGKGSTFTVRLPVRRGVT